jgi:hypothetical protein
MKYCQISIQVNRLFDCFLDIKPLYTLENSRLTDGQVFHLETASNTAVVLCFSISP